MYTLPPPRGTAFFFPRVNGATPQSKLTLSLNQAMDPVERMTMPTFPAASMAEPSLPPW